MMWGRGLSVLATGLAMWIVGWLIGSPGLAVVGVGLVALPLLATFSARRGRLGLKRRLSEARVPPGTRVTVELDIENRSPWATPFLLIEDAVSVQLGRHARLVLAGVPPHNTQRARYTLVPEARGVYPLGPLTIDLSDPFALSRRRLRFDVVDQLLVTPEVEDLRSAPHTPFGSNVGASRARNLLRTGEEFFTMRQYQTGDDLRRIHWASVARTGDLMIRQDESARRSNALVFIDTRETGLGLTHGAAFERAISCAASIGVLLYRAGFSLRVATAASPPVRVTEEAFLDILAGVGHDQGRGTAASLTRLGPGSGADTSFVLVGAPPAPSELSTLIRMGRGLGPKLAVFVYPAELEAVSADRRTQLEGRASQARHSLARAGWDVIVLSPSAHLRDAWNEHRTLPLASTV